MRLTSGGRSFAQAAPPHCSPRRCNAAAVTLKVNKRPARATRYWQYLAPCMATARSASESPLLTSCRLSDQLEFPCQGQAGSGQWQRQPGSRRHKRAAAAAAQDEEISSADQDHLPQSTSYTSAEEEGPDESREFALAMAKVGKEQQLAWCGWWPSLSTLLAVARGANFPGSCAGNFL